MAGSFERYARTERLSAYVAYATGIATAATGVLVLLLAFGHIVTVLPWQSIVLKIGITTGLGAIATVAFRFGGNAIQRATSFKRQELELRALGPFLSDVEGSGEAKVDFIKRAFGSAWPGRVLPASADTDLLPSVVKGLTRAVADLPRALGKQ